MDLKTKWSSRKLLATLLVILVIAGSDLAGLGLDENTVDAILKAVLGFVGAQGLVDAAGAFAAARKVADAVEGVKEEIDADES